jgi:hypothetical protein
LIIEPEHFCYRDCDPGNTCHWCLQIYVFAHFPPLRYCAGRAVLDAAIEGLAGPFSSVVRMNVVNLPTERICLGLYVNCMRTHPSPESGWVLCGPGDYGLQEKGHVLMGFCPREAVHDGKFASIDRKPTDATT